MIRANKITGSAPEVTLIELNVTGAGITLSDDYAYVCVTGTWINSSPFSPSSASITVNGTSVGTLDEVKVGGNAGANYNSITFAHVLSDLHAGDVITPTGGAGITATASYFGVK